jgi:hypothetical protein
METYHLIRSRSPSPEREENEDIVYVVKPDPNKTELKPFTPFTTFSENKKKIDEYTYIVIHQKNSPLKVRNIIVLFDMVLRFIQQYCYEYPLNKMRTMFVEKIEEFLTNDFDKFSRIQQNHLIKILCKLAMLY